MDVNQKDNYANLQEGRVLDNQYELVRRIGRGRSCVIWVAKHQPTDRHVVIKIYRSGEDNFKQPYGKFATKEVEILSKIHRTDPSGHKPIVRIIDHFSFRSKASGKHQAIVMSLGGCSISTVVDQHWPASLPPTIAKYVATQLLEAVTFLHEEVRVVHGDIKSHDLLLCRNTLTKKFEPEPQPFMKPIRLGKDVTAASAENADAFALQQSTAGMSKNQKRRLREKMKRRAAAAAKEGGEGADVEGATAAVEKASVADKEEPAGKEEKKPDLPLFVPHPDTFDLSTPEGRQKTLESQWRVLLSDFGHSSFVLKWEHDRDMFPRPNRSPEQVFLAPVDESTDVWACACLIFELFTGDWLFEIPPPTDCPDPVRRDEDHLADMLELTGQTFPKDVVQLGQHSQFLFHPNMERLKRVNPRNIKVWPLEKVLMEKYHWAKKEADEFASFLRPMLDLDPRKRPKSREVLDHPFLKYDVSELKAIDFEWEMPEFQKRPLPPHFEKIREEDANQRRGNAEAAKELNNAIRDGLTFAERFAPRHRVGHGAFSEVYFGEDLVSGAAVAVKVEIKLFHEESLLLNEARIYQQMSQYEAFPKFFWAGREADYTATIMEFLGNDLHKKKFGIPVCLKLAIQLTRGLEALHDEGYLHNDLKPGNIVFRDKSSVCIVDLGLAETWRNPDGTHIPWKTGLKMLGNPKFASVNNHRGNALSRRDDMEAMAYCFMEFLRGDTPWHGVSRNSLGKNRVEQFKPLCDVKANTPAEAMFKGYPACFTEYLKQVTALDFEARPDYDGLVKILADTLRSEYNTEPEDVTYNVKYELPVPVREVLEAAPKAEDALKEHPVEINLDFKPRADGKVLSLHQREDRGELGAQNATKDKGEKEGGKKKQERGRRM